MTTATLKNNLTQQPTISLDEIEARVCRIQEMWDDNERSRRAQLASLRTEALLMAMVKGPSVAQSA